MLKATDELIAAGPGAAGAGWQRAGELVRVIGHLGTRADADALQAHFLDDPARNDFVLPVLERHGDATLARQLLYATTDARGLLPDMPAGLLRTFGYHGLSETRAMLWGYARTDPAWRSGNEHSTSTAATYGLLHLPCDDLADEIDAEIRSYVGRNLFPEYLPALAASTGRARLLDVLWQIADTASTDCNGGLILGTALYGEHGRARFHELMWSDAWEAANGSTGSVHALLDGTYVLGIRIADVAAEWKRRLDAGERPLHGFVLVEGLLEARLRSWHSGLRFADTPPDGVADLHASLFRWSTPMEDDSVPAIARRALDADGYPFTDELVDHLSGLEEVLLARSTEELMLREWESRRR